MTIVENYGGRLLKIGIAYGGPIQWIVLLLIITEKKRQIFWNPEKSGIDAFMQSWKVENNW